MRRLLNIGLTLVFSFAGLMTEAQFISHGKIEFERRTNQHSLLDEENMWEEMMKSNFPKFVNVYYDLRFDSTASLYKAGRDPDTRMIHWGLNYITSTVYKDFRNQTFVDQKNIFGNDFLISDTLQKLKWKITGEFRTIAGFECRKAVTTILDSIVVIAFYTDEIIPSTGPEMFGDLPGMILGLAIPRMHTTWYATKLEIEGVKPGEIVPPKNGKKFNETEFEKEIKEIIRERQWLKKLSWQLLL